MFCSLVTATAYIRKMRGGAQAHLLQGDDGHTYVVKFQNNPQHRRVLINEFIASAILKYLDIYSPEIAIMQVDEAFLRQNPDVYISLKHGNTTVQCGPHFASRHPGNPSKTPVYDFLPDAMLRQVLNLHHFLGMLVFDKWVSNLDYRQSIFFRSRVRFGAGPAQLGFAAAMIDNGFVFGGAEWAFSEAPLTGLHANRAVYRDAQSMDDFEPWLHQIARFPEDLLRRACQAIPAEWLATDRYALEQMLERLLRRRARISDLVQSCWREMKEADGANAHPRLRPPSVEKKDMGSASRSTSLQYNHDLVAAMVLGQ